MDLNFNLLTSDEIKIIQDISCATLNLYGDKNFSFKDLREKINVIITPKDERDRFYDCIDNELKFINNYITNKLPESYFNSYDEYLGYLRNYISINNDDNIPNYDDWLNEMMNNKDKRNNEEHNHNHIKDHDFSQNDIERINLEARKERLESDRKRLEASPEDRTILLGIYQVERDTNGKILSKNVFLFIDNIEASAKVHDVDRKDVLASTFIHEMFHAYYDCKLSNFIMSSMWGIIEIEEAMAEFGMLSFLKQFDKTKTILPYAEQSVKDKILSTNSTLHCYGMGHALYKIAPTTMISTKKCFSTYQYLKHAPNMLDKDVATYICYVASNPLNYPKCYSLFKNVLNRYHKEITKGKLYEFNGEKYGNKSFKKLIRDVLEDYSHGGKPLIDMKTDFDNTNAKFGTYHIFEEESNIKTNNLENHYDMEHANKLTLSSGETICIAKVWSGNKNGNMEEFVKQVNKIYFNKGIKVLGNIY